MKQTVEQTVEQTVKQTVKLESNNGVTVEIPLEYTQNSGTIQNVINDTGAESIPLPEVDGDTLRKVVEFLIHFGENPVSAEERIESVPWYIEYTKIGQSQLFSLILAANYLDIKPLLDLTCKTVANMIKGKTPEEIRAVFGIKNDFTPEEEAQVKKENEWCEV